MMQPSAHAAMAFLLRVSVHLIISIGCGFKSALSSTHVKKEKKEAQEDIADCSVLFVLTSALPPLFYCRSLVFCSLEQVIFVMTSTLPLTGNIFSPLCSVQGV